MNAVFPLEPTESGQAATGRPGLCRPSPDLSCFRCCPPIRPPDYDHFDFRGFLKRELAENRQVFITGNLPHKEILGFSCPGLGFVDGQGKLVGCLLHPARNQGRDLRTVTGYAAKCARETCPPFRTFAALDRSTAEVLLKLCAGMDSFVFSSLRQNPVMRLMQFGLLVTETMIHLGLTNLKVLSRLTWLNDCPSVWGWLLERGIIQHGPDLLNDPDLPVSLNQAVDILVRLLQPRPPLETGRPLAQLCPEGEARFWRSVGGRSRVRPRELKVWQRRAEEVIGKCLGQCK